MVYVQDENGNPLMPTRRHGKERRMLRDGRSVTVSKLALVAHGKGITFQATTGGRDSSPSSANAAGGGFLAED